MARIKGGMNAKKKHKRVLKLAKGYRGARSKQYRVAKQSVMRALEESYTGRKQKKGEDEEQFIKAIAILKNQHKQEIADLQGQIKQRDEIIRLQNKEAELLKRGLKKRGIDTENIIKAEKNKKSFSLG